MSAAIPIFRAQVGDGWYTCCAMPPLGSPLTDAEFTLSIWGVAGIFGGDEAISSMALVPLHQQRGWLGWYNTPGSLKLARYFGRLAHSSPLWKQLSPYTSESPPVLFAIDGEKGPRYTAALSGTDMETGHLGYLAMDWCKEIVEETMIAGRETLATPVAFINLAHVPETLNENVPRVSKSTTFLALIPINVSVVTCLMCALAYDWYSFSVILFGMIVNGFATIAIGLGKLQLKFPKAAPGSPDGDGALIFDDIVVVVKGAENAVNVITKGKFVLEHRGRFVQHAMGICALLLILEFLIQLLLVPQGSLFGQLMFVISICVSWSYTFYVSSTRRARIQGDVLFQTLGSPPIRKFRLGTRTAMAFFVTLLIYHGISNPSRASVERTLRTFLPNRALVWDKWMKKATRQVCDNSLSCLELEEGDEHGLRDSEKALLSTLLEDASAAYDGYKLHYAKQG